MNLNILTYCIYLSAMSYIIFVVGKICYTNGNIFVSALIPGHEDLCYRINRMLLIGYYLVNIGYVAMTLASWTDVENPVEIVETVSAKMSVIIALLCILHYFNIFIITKYVNKLIH